MKKWSALVLLFISFSLMALMFNNCSEGNDFSSGSDQSQLNSDGTSGNDDTSGTVDGNAGRDLTDDEIDSILNNIPQDEIDNPVPISELESDPTLYDRYSCGSGSVAICHFPNNVDAQGSKCVGQNAISSHYDHIRVYMDGNQSKQIGDYLGPCRVPLYN